MELSVPFAIDGDRTEFSINTTSDGSISLQQGYTNKYSTPLTEGGLTIDRTDFNQLMYLLSSGIIENKTQINEILNNGINPTIETQTYMIGTGGDFEKLSKAFDFLRGKRLAAKLNNKNTPTLIILVLKAGYVETEQQIFLNDDFSNIYVTSENFTEIVINAVNFKSNDFIIGYYSKLPIFLVDWSLINMPGLLTSNYVAGINCFWWTRGLTGLYPDLIPTRTISLKGFKRFFSFVYSSIIIDCNFIFDNAITEISVLNANSLGTIGNFTLDFSSCVNQRANYYIQILGSTQMSINNLNKIILPQGSTKQAFNIVQNTLTRNGILQTYTGA